MVSGMVPFSTIQADPRLDLSPERYLISPRKHSEELRAAELNLRRAQERLIRVIREQADDHRRQARLNIEQPGAEPLYPHQGA
jgi:hypothetical protein